jgi:hypothetical protein
MCMGNQSAGGPSPRKWGNRTTPLSRMTVGSPPRKWGNPAPRTPGQGLRRIIPTYVGKPAERPPRCPPVGSPPLTWGTFFHRIKNVLFNADHPHVSGETITTSNPKIQETRTIPTCVGKPHFVGNLHQACVRTIPTYVGKPIDTTSPTGRLIGSPPHMWGNRKAVF